MLCGGLMLAIMILPIITAISRDVLRAVPRAQVEGTAALGATWWQSSKEMLKYSRSGLFGAVMLGLARAAGETMAVTMVIGNNPQIKPSPFMPAQTMSSLLATQFAEADSAEHRSALFEVALILLVMSLAFNIVARYLVVGKGARTSAAHYDAEEMNTEKLKTPRQRKVAEQIVARVLSRVVSCLALHLSPAWSSWRLASDHLRLKPVRRMTESIHNLTARWTSRAMFVVCTLFTV